MIDFDQLEQNEILLDDEEIHFEEVHKVIQVVIFHDLKIYFHDSEDPGNNNRQGLIWRIYLEACDEGKDKQNQNLKNQCISTLRRHMKSQFLI